MKKRICLLLMLCMLMLCMLMLLVCACKQNPSEQQLFAKLIAHFEDRGYACTLAKLEEPDRAVPIYKAEAWHSLRVNGEEVLVYFDESNRADYLSEPVDEAEYGHVSRFGLRFVVVYPGEDEGIIQALDEMPR